jgi:hypothetical protein
VTLISTYGVKLCFLPSERCYGGGQPTAFSRAVPQEPWFRWLLGAAGVFVGDAGGEDVVDFVLLGGGDGYRGVDFAVAGECL